MKYASPRDDGLKPWVVTRHEWGRHTSRVVYAETAATAKYQTIGRERHVSATVRRATPDDIVAHDFSGGVA
jgi:hypothetical protein